MLIISRTPVRISFFGGGTDYPDYYLRNEGAVLGTTINQYTHVSVSTQAGFFEHQMRIAYSKTELVSNLNDIEHPSVRESLRRTNVWGHLDVHIFSDLPARTGLGSSSSFTVGFLNALHALQGKRISKKMLAEEACFIEQKMIQEHVGSQDQFHAAYGGLNIIEFKSTGIELRPVITSKEKLKYLESHLMLFYTGLTRHASEILKEQIANTQTRSKDSYLKEMREMVFTAENILCNQPKETMIKEIGRLLHESWQMKKELSSKISNPFIDQAYAAAKTAGALGGKLCGAGSGGFLALLVEEERKDDVRKALQGLLEVPVQFDNTGSSIIYMKE